MHSGVRMPDARWSMHVRSKNDRRCPMHGKLRMPDGRCTMHAGVPIPVRTSGPLLTISCGKTNDFTTLIENTKTYKEREDISCLVVGVQNI